MRRGEIIKDDPNHSPLGAQGKWMREQATERWSSGASTPTTISGFASALLIDIPPIHTLLLTKLYLCESVLTPDGLGGPGESRHALLEFLVLPLFQRGQDLAHGGVDSRGVLA